MLTRNVKIRYFSWIVAVTFLFVLTGCSSPKENIPITTQSEGALKIFIEGRDLQEKFLTNSARELFEKAIAADPDFALAHLHRAGFFTATSAADFQKHFQRVLELASNVTEGERLQIEIIKAYVDNDAAKAVAMSVDLVEKFPNDKRARENLGNAFWGQDKDELAIAEFEKAIALDKDFAPAYNSLGYAYREMENYDKAEEAFKKYIRLIPDEPNPHDSIADLYTKMGRHEDAIDHYKRALALRPTFAISQQKIGDNLVFMGKYEEGREAYRQAIAIEKNPSPKIAHQNQIARSYLYEGNIQQPLVELDMSQKMAEEAGLPERIAGVHSQKCSISIESGNLNAAEKSLAACKQVVMASELRQSFKDNFAKGALFQDALIAAKRKDFKKAEGIAGEYLAKIEVDNNPSEMQTNHDLLGHIAFEKGDKAAAVEHFRQGNQEDPYTLYRLALSESEVGNSEIAANLFNKVANWNASSLSYALVRSDAMTHVYAILLIPFLRFFTSISSDINQI